MRHPSPIDVARGTFSSASLDCFAVGGLRVEGAEFCQRTRGARGPGPRHNRLRFGGVLRRVVERRIQGLH